jgi:hypothetical protein
MNNLAILMRWRASIWDDLGTIAVCICTSKDVVQEQLQARGICKGVSK